MNRNNDKVIPSKFAVNTDASFKGKVKWFNKEKGYGFLLSDDGGEYFVHISKVKDRHELNNDDRVEFKLIETPKGIQAVDVDVIISTNLNIA